jgi:putative peptide zinc metalloprotease protein
MTPTPAEMCGRSERPTTLRMRPDLVIREQRFSRRRQWVIKDPVSLRYVMLGEEEYSVLNMLDGRTGFEEIKQRFEKMFPPRRVSTDRLLGFLSACHRQGLLVADVSGQGLQLRELHRDRRTRSLVAGLSNVLALRFRGIDPEPFLQWMYPRCAWLFSRWCFGVSSLVVLIAVLGLVAQAKNTYLKMPGTSEILNQHNLVWLAISVALVKTLHEIGHALTCKHFGGECHEMGIMLLAFVPCLYCDVSDSWIIRNKWERVAISAAGIWVEIVLASVAALLWFLSQPGVLNQICLNVMVVGSLSAVLLNGNPLLRYDGYYVLSDIVEVPNLWQRSRALVQGWIGSWCFGVETPNRHLLPERHQMWLGGYAVASMIYRWLVVVAILLLLFRTLKPYRLELVAWLVSLMVLFGLLTAPVVGFRRLTAEMRHRDLKPSRIAARSAIVLLLLALIGLLPWPCRVTAPMTINLENPHHVYVSVPGTLLDTVEPYSQVQSGSRLATLDNPELRRQVIGLKAERSRLRLRLANLEARRHVDQEAASQIPAAREALADIEERLLQRSEDEARLIVTAPTCGVVFPPSPVSDDPNRHDGLPTWRGTPLETRNAEAFLKTGTLLCVIGDPSRHEAVAFLDQSDSEYVREGQRVRMLLEQLPGKVLWGTLVELAKADSKVVPRDLVGNEETPSVERQSAHATMSLPPLRARVSLDEHSHRVLIGARGKAKILVDPQPLGRLLYRFLCRTFAVEL